MARTSIIPALTRYEEILSVTHSYPKKNSAGTIDVIVGIGTIVDGEFEFTQNQQYQTVRITGANYDSVIINNPKFNRDDLWTQIDLIREATV
jgi:hypothetical protein